MSRSFKGDACECTLGKKGEEKDAGFICFLGFSARLCIETGGNVSAFTGKVSSENHQDQLQPRVEETICSLKVTGLNPLTDLSDAEAEGTI